MQLGKKETNDDVCKPILKKAVCFFVFPLCSSQQQKMDICREDCDYLYELCGKDLDHVRMSLIYNILFGQSLCTIASTSATSRVEFQLLCIFQACRCWPVFAFRQVVWYCFSLRWMQRFKERERHFMFALTILRYVVCTWNVLLNIVELYERLFDYC